MFNTLYASCVIYGVTLSATSARETTNLSTVGTSPVLRFSVGRGAREVPESPQSPSALIRQGAVGQTMQPTATYTIVLWFE